MLGFCGNYNKRLGCFLPAWECSIRKFRVRKLPGVFQKWGANMLELVGTKGIGEGGEIAQESHRYPKCLAKRFFVPENAVVQATWRKLYPIYSVRKGQSGRKRGWTRKSLAWSTRLMRLEWRAPHCESQKGLKNCW